GGSPWRKLRELGVKVPKEFAVLPPMVLDRLSTDWVLGPGNHLLTHYKSPCLQLEKNFTRTGLECPAL
ncbi:hypothetical protein LM602_03290, partial [Candidatus Acetothermia bacterium]|nr:hypothetical protein [Candidatus Acetothermia bacterium]MCI2435838.1 hypothetical protein [Candidatus Acetothermia bacterium]